MKRRRNRASRTAGTAIRVLGILLICGALALAAYNVWDANRAARASNDVLARLQEEIAIRMAERGDDTGKTAAAEASGGEDREMPTIEIDGYRYIGYLKIPAADLFLPVMETCDLTRLRTAPCRYSGSYFTDDLVICGHNYAHHFSPIKRLDINAEIEFITADGVRYQYIVDNRETVQPTEVQRMIDNEEGLWDLTLYTCTTDGQARCAVRCVRAEEEASV